MEENNWIIDNINHAFGIWNSKLTEIWQLVSQTPSEFKDGTIWQVIININEALKAIGFGLLILFFAISVFRSTINFQDFKRPEFIFKLFIRFVATKVAITYCLNIMTTIFSICTGVITKLAQNMGDMTAAGITLPEEIIAAVNDVGFFASIPLWLVTLLGSLFILILSFVMILTVYGRFFRIYMYTALAPIPLASFAGESTSSIGKSFIKSYVGVALEGAVIVLACLIFTAFISSGSPGLIDPGASAVTQVWSYLAETIFNMLILVGLIKGADRIVKEMMGL